MTQERVIGPFSFTVILDKCNLGYVHSEQLTCIKDSMALSFATATVSPRGSKLACATQLAICMHTAQSGHHDDMKPDHVRDASHCMLPMVPLCQQVPSRLRQVFTLMQLR